MARAGGRGAPAASAGGILGAGRSGPAPAPGRGAGRSRHGGRRGGGGRGAVRRPAQAPAPGGGLTQEALAERAGVSARAVSDLERDPRLRPRLDTVALLADALGLDPEQRARLLAAARPGTEAAAPAAAPAPASRGRRASGPVPCRARSPR